MTDIKTEQILVLGGSGQIGSRLVDYLIAEGFKCQGTSRSKGSKSYKGHNLVLFDMSMNIEPLLCSTNYTNCVIAAAEANIDKCENDQSSTYFINVERTIDVINKCVKHGTHFIYLSSDCVFDGKSSYKSVDDIPSPCTAYGKQKLAVENYILEHCKDYGAILRLTKVVGKNMPLLVKWRNSLDSGQSISAFTDKYISPVQVDDVCRVITSMIERKNSGLFQFGGSNESSYYEFALSHFGPKSNIEEALSQTQNPYASLETFLPTYEAQYDPLLMAERVNMGLMTNYQYTDNPVRLAFTFSRYKFVAKMFNGLPEVLEIGCADAFASAIVSKAVGKLTCCDIDNTFINYAKRTHHYRQQINFIQNDFTTNSLMNKFDGIFLMDVLEHISPSLEHTFIVNILSNLKEDGIAIIGIPSLESQVYASEISRQGHVNCKSGNDFSEFLKRYFNNVFLFSMNDEVVHTGFSQLAHYLIALCCSPKTSY